MDNLKRIMTENPEKFSISGLRGVPFEEIIEFKQWARSKGITVEHRRETKSGMKLANNGLLILNKHNIPKPLFKNSNNVQWTKIPQRLK